MTNEPSHSEMTRARAWVQEHGAVESLPFSFRLGGRPSAELLPEWTLREEALPGGDGVASRRLTWTDPDTGLACVYERTAYADNPVVEWVVRFRNEGTDPAPLLSDVRGLDLSLGTDDATLHHHTGDTCGPDSFAPHALPLERGSRYSFAPVGGRPTSVGWPFFNMEHDGSGMILVLGWPGQWQAEFARDAEGALSVRGGQQTAEFRLAPGEEARTPLSVILLWQGDRRRAQNLWRRWMQDHSLPRRHGRLMEPMSSHCMGPGFTDALARHDAHADYFWMDAGWWKEGFPLAGNWEPDPDQFPQGLRPMSDHAHAHGMKYILWFEPERVSPGSPWTRLHDRWLLALPPHERRFRHEEHMGWPHFTAEEAERNQMLDGDRLFNLGDPDARTFLTDFLSQRVTEWGIDILRIDFNISPLAFWHVADAPDRRGLTENHYVTGWLAMLDELLRRHPDLWIDTCASGGRRMDLETLRRASPLTRSDLHSDSHPVGTHSHTFGLASWVPYFGIGAFYGDPYVFRSSLLPATNVAFRREPGGAEWDLFRRQLQECAETGGFFSGDYYPLTEHTLNDDAWMAWQFHRPDRDAGMVQVFRRSASPYETARLKLSGLDADAAYEVRDMDDTDMTGATRHDGAALLQTGLEVRVTTAPQAMILFYHRVAASDSS